MTLLIIGLAAGLITGVSPCVLPVLPAVLMAGATTPTEGQAPAGRSVAVVSGIVISFAILTLVGSALVRALSFPQNLLHILGIVLLLLIGLGLLLPALGDLLDKPFLRLPSAALPPSRGGFLLGLSLGAVYVPCAGPVLAALVVVGATGRLGPGSVLLMAAFAVGAGIPLLIIALAGSNIVRRTRALAERARTLRIIAGCVLIGTAVVVAFNLAAGLQVDIPGYTNFLQQRIETTPQATTLLHTITAEPTPPLADCFSNALQDCGTAPPFTNITAWLNTPGDQPITLASLRGQVVLVDFWTYTCINCRRTLPHLETWYKLYHPDGFTIVGVEAPEFAFEHIVANVQTAAQQLGIVYPIAVDDDYGTWDAYGVEYWPTEFLIDATGQVRHIDIGEGDYTETQDLIRDLLAIAHPGITLPPPSSVPNLTPTQQTTPESYLGYDRLDNLFNGVAGRDETQTFTLPKSLPLNYLALGGTWTIHSEEMTAGSGAEIELHYYAQDVYLVLEGTGTVQASTIGGPTRTITVSGIPNLYTMVHGAAYTGNTLTLKLSPGIEAYDFTFG